MPNSSRTPLSFSKTCRTSASGWTTASSCVGVRPTTGSNQGQSDRGRDSRRARQRGVHLADVPRLRSSRSAESTSGVCVSARRLPRIGVPSRYERGRQTTSGGQQDRVAILRRSTSPAALIRGGESLPWKSAGDDSARDGSACDSTTGHREATRGPPDRRPLRRTVPKPPRRASLPL